MRLLLGARENVRVQVRVPRCGSSTPAPSLRSPPRRGIVNPRPDPVNPRPDPVNPRPDPVNPRLCHAFTCLARIPRHAYHGVLLAVEFPTKPRAPTHRSRPVPPLRHPGPRQPERGRPPRRAGCPIRPTNRRSLPGPRAAPRTATARRAPATPLPTHPLSRPAPPLRAREAVLLSRRQSLLPLSRRHSLTPLSSALPP